MGNRITVMGGVFRIVWLILIASPLRSSYPVQIQKLSFVPTLQPSPWTVAVHRTSPLKLSKHSRKCKHVRLSSLAPSTWKCVAGSNHDFTIAVSTVMGLESVVKEELLQLGYPDARPVGASGRVELEGGSEAIVKCNLHLRSATRVMLVLSRWKAMTFDDLFDGTNAIPWEDLIHAGASFPVRGKSVKSTLHSVPACQSIVKKAIIARLLAADPSLNFDRNNDGWLQEDARKGVYGIEVSIQKDEVTISLDTSGDALHRRGYRTGVLEGGAPLKETLAASMLILSKWTPERPLLDPFCGSGTILLEAALMAHGIAPGLRRSFAAEDWPLVCNAHDWKNFRTEAEERVVASPQGVQIYGADINRRAVEMTYQHLQAAGLEKSVQLSVADIHQLPPPPGEYGCIVTNPPYGERLGGAATANEGIGRIMGQVHERGWSLFCLSGDATFEEQVGRMSTKRRKLYNGKLPCQFYQYFGSRPPSVARQQKVSGGTTSGAGGKADDSLTDEPGAKEGDWCCPKCKSMVFGSKAACFQCGYEKRDDWACPSCHCLVFASKSACFKCGTPRGGGEDGGRCGSGILDRGGGGGTGGAADTRMGQRREGGVRRRGNTDMTVLFLSKGTSAKECSRARVGLGGGGMHGAELAGTWSLMSALRLRALELSALDSTAQGEQSEGDAGGVSGWDPTNKEWTRVGQWVCMKQCGACCYLAASDSPDDEAVAAQLKAMTAPDGWCKHFDKESRGCSIYDTRPSFCRTSPKSFQDLYGVPPELFETVARSSCCDAISDVYGPDSPELDRYKDTAGGSDWPDLSELISEM